MMYGVNCAGGVLPVVVWSKELLRGNRVDVSECTDRGEARNRKAFGGVGRLVADSGWLLVAF